MRITEVEAILLRGDQKYGATAGAEEAVDNGDWQLIVRVATDAGLEGWSDVETLAPAAAAIISGQGMAILGFRTLSELLVGENPLDVEALWDKLYVGSAYYGRRGVAMHCISAIDNCLWSIRAEAAGMSLARLLGGRRRDRITAYASTLFRSTPEGMAEHLRGFSVELEGCDAALSGLAAEPGDLTGQNARISRHLAPVFTELSGMLQAGAYWLDNGMLSPAATLSTADRAMIGS